MAVSSPSLTKIAGKLIEAGMIRETGVRGEGGSGRPRQNMVLAENNWRVICATMMPGQLQVGIAGPDARLLAQRTILEDLSADAAIARLLPLSQELLAECGVGPDAVAGLCLTVPGHVDPSGRHILAVSRPGWGGGDLIDQLEAQSAWPVTIENKVNAMAFAEAVYGEDALGHGLAYIYLAQGLGAAYLREGPGAAFSGSNALELGHVTVETPGLPCRCGLSGCFETVLTADLARTAPADDPRWDAVAQGFANLLNLLGPELVVVGGELAKLGPAQLETLYARIRARLMPHQRDRISFRVSGLGPDAALLGAAAVALDRFYFSGETL